MALVLDAGALIAFDRGDRTVGALIEVARRRADPVLTSSGAVAQVWRGGPRQARLSRLLEGTDERPLDPSVSRDIGELCRSTERSDVVDAHISLLAEDGDLVLTSDPEDIRALLRATGTRAEILGC